VADAFSPNHGVLSIRVGERKEWSLPVDSLARTLTFMNRRCARGGLHNGHKPRKIARFLVYNCELGLYDISMPHDRKRRPVTRVVHVLAELRPSGAETMLLAAVPYWREAGIETYVVSTGSTVGDFSQNFTAASVITDHQPFAKTPGFFFGLYRFFKRTKPDVVHIHTERASVWIAITASLARVPRLVRTVHHVFEFDGWLRWKRLLGRRFMRRILGVRLVTNSPSNVANEIARFGYTPAYVPNWYDDQSFHLASPADRTKARALFGLAVNDFAVVTIASCASYKNHDLIIRALSRLDSDRVVYLHAGSEQEGEPERELATALGVGVRVRFLGVVESPSSVLAAADLFLMPSEVEGFGIAALEALAVGTPSVLADVPGLRDFKDVVPEGIRWIQPTEDEIFAAIVSSQTERDLVKQPNIAQLNHFSAYHGAAAYLDHYVH
jgi:glycosyltransferase involved in cell wall biosynthesis